MDPLVQRIQVALQQLKRNLDTEMLQLMNVQVTVAQMYLLYTLHKKQQCRLTQLAETMDVKPSAITVMIDRLEKQNYVRRIQDREDRRAILVELTPEGQEVLQQAIRIRGEILSRHLSRLEPHETEVVADLLEKMVTPVPSEASEHKSNDNN